MTGHWLKFIVLNASLLAFIGCKDAPSKTETKTKIAAEHVNAGRHTLVAKVKDDAFLPKASRQSVATCDALVEGDIPWAHHAPNVVQKSAIEQSLPDPSPRLKRRMAFWTRLWRDTPDRVYLMFDGRRPSYIHGEVDCREFFVGKDNEDQKGDALCDKKLVAAKKKVIAKLSKKVPDALKRVLDNDVGRINSVTKNIRFMRGKSHELKAAIDRATPHLKRVENVFTHVGVPKALSRLSIIESLFKPEVVSRSGAVGAFQLMAPTARPWLRVANGVDERKDVERSAYASASYLKQMRDQLGLDEWPLVLTGYNTGPTRMRRIVKKHGTKDIGKLADIRTERNFGFDGQNYYASFLSIIDITKNLSALDAGDANAGAKVLNAELSLSALAQCTGSTINDLLEANPALKQNLPKPSKTNAAANTETKIPLIAKVPKGYVVNLPLPRRALVKRD